MKYRKVNIKENERIDINFIGTKYKKCRGNFTQGIVIENKGKDEFKITLCDAKVKVLK